MHPAPTVPSPSTHSRQGSLAAGTFAAYSPVTREAEVCDVQPMGGEDEEEVEEEEEEEEAAGGMDLDAAAVQMEAGPAAFLVA